MFPAREANFQQLTYRSPDSPERSPDSPGNSRCRIQCPGVSFARPLRRKYFRPVLDSFVREASLLFISGLVLFLRALGYLFTIGV